MNFLYIINICVPLGISGVNWQKVSVKVNICIPIGKITCTTSRILHIFFTLLISTRVALVLFRNRVLVETSFQKLAQDAQLCSKTQVSASLKIVKFTMGFECHILMLVALFQYDESYKSICTFFLSILKVVLSTLLIPVF